MEDMKEGGQCEGDKMVMEGAEDQYINMYKVIKKKKKTKKPLRQNFPRKLHINILQACCLLKITRADDQTLAVVWLTPSKAIMKTVRSLMQIGNHSSL